MSVRNNDKSVVPDDVGADTLATLQAARSADSPFSPANTYTTADPSNPLERRVHVSLRATLDDLSQKRGASTWAPSPSAAKRIFQQTKFTDLSGKAERHGDMKSVVLHSVQLEEAGSNFPISVGAKISGVDSNTFTLNGECFSHVLLPETTSSNPRMLQSDDVDAAYEFAKKFPGYTSDNLSTKGIVKCDERNFALVAADHPVCAAIQENAETLQTGDISMMPEGLVKIGADLYKSMAPAVKTQVASQLRVRDFSTASVSFQPTDYPSWSAARAALVKTRHATINQAAQNEIAALPTDAPAEAAQSIKKRMSLDLAKAEASVGHTPCTVNMTLRYTYNFLAE